MLVRRGDEQTAVHLSDAMDHDRLNPHVGSFRIEVVQAAGGGLRVVLEETEGIAMDLHWRGLFPAIQEAPHVMRTGDAEEGPRRPAVRAVRHRGRARSSIDGEDIAVTPDRWIGSRDRSWGIRPSGEAEPPGRRRARRATACGGSTSRSRSTTSGSA